MSEDFDREDDLQCFARPYLFDSEYTDDELTEMDILCQHHTHVLWNCRERASKTNIQENKLSNKVIFVFFVHKKFYRSFIKLRLYHRCHMDYFNMSLLPFWALNAVGMNGSCVAICAQSGSSRIS